MPSPRESARKRRTCAKWSIARLADAIEAGLLQESARLEAEQAIYGLDSLDELSLQPAIARSLEQAGYGVHREQRYPAYRQRRKASEGDRADFVLTPDARPLARPEQPPTLFDPPDAVALADAFWMELKLVAQFTTKGPNRDYSSQWLGPVVEDVVKLAREPAIRHAGLLIVLFVQDARIAAHDFAAWQARCIERRLPLGRPALRSVPISDRLGNSLCRLALYSVRRAEARK